MLKVLKNRRNHIRFQPTEKLSYGLVQTSGTCDGNFDPEIVGLIVNESYSGCCLAIRSDVPDIGQVCKVKIGEIGPLPAKVIWTKEVDENISYIGMRYEEE